MNHKTVVSSNGMRNIGEALFCAAPLLLLGLAAPSAHAQPYPNKPIKLVVPFVPGGGSDTVARVLAHGLTERLGEQVVVENRGGANTIIGTEYVAKSRPDGYTLLVCTGSFVINPSLYKLNYDTLKDLIPVTMYLSGRLLLVVHPSLPVKNVKELVALAKAKPGELTFSSYGAGSPSHLAGELLKDMTGINMLHVPFKGSQPSISEVVAGRVSMTFGVMTPVMPFVKAGRLRAIAFTTPKRVPDHPDIPTVAETVPGFEAVGLNGICAPAGTPKEIIQTLHTNIAAVMTDQPVRKKLIDGGADIVERPLPPEEFGPLVRSEMAKWKKVVDKAGIKVQ